MTRQVQRLRTFAEELEELARIESGQLTLHLEEVDAATVARQVAGDLGSVAEKRGVGVAIVGGATPLRTDPVRLAQVLTNLMDNAIRYNHPGGQVTMRIGAGDEGVRVEVEDTGVGIPACEVGLVFQRFYRVRRSGSGGGKRARPRDREASREGPGRNGQPHLANRPGYDGDTAPPWCQLEPTRHSRSRGNSSSPSPACGWEPLVLPRPMLRLSWRAPEIGFTLSSR